jgi:hypothetical protein
MLNLRPVVTAIPAESVGNLSFCLFGPTQVRFAVSTSFHFHLKRRATHLFAVAEVLAELVHLYQLFC